MNLAFFCLQINTYNFYFSCISVQVHVNIIIKQKNKLVLLVLAAYLYSFLGCLGRVFIFGVFLRLFRLAVCSCWCLGWVLILGSVFALLWICSVSMLVLGVEVGTCTCTCRVFALLWACSTFMLMSKNSRLCSRKCLQFGFCFGWYNNRWFLDS